MTSKDERALAVLTCPWNHVLLWPHSLTPYPDSCVAKIATTPYEPTVFCGKALTKRGVAKANFTADEIINGGMGR
jgi:hypothetical protein